jgi:hypothetical protein
LGFYGLFVLPEDGDISQVQTEVFWEEVSPWPIITFWDLLQSIFLQDDLTFVSCYHSFLEGTMTEKEDRFRKY